MNQENPKSQEAAGDRPDAAGSAAILDYPSKPGWWWAWNKSAARWYIINISHDDIDEESVPPYYEGWTECVPPLPPNTQPQPTQAETQTRPAPRHPARPCSAESFPKQQDDLDWRMFSAAFEKRNGLTPHPMDTGHQEFFRWFTVGAHEEFMGRLNVKPNAVVRHEHGADNALKQPSA